MAGGKENVRPSNRGGGRSKSRSPRKNRQLQQQLAARGHLKSLSLDKTIDDGFAVDFPAHELGHEGIRIGPPKAATAAQRQAWGEGAGVGELAGRAETIIPRFPPPSSKNPHTYYINHPYLNAGGNIPRGESYRAHHQVSPVKSATRESLLEAEDLDGEAITRAFYDTLLASKAQARQEALEQDSDALTITMATSENERPVNGASAPTDKENDSGVGPAEEKPADTSAVVNGVGDAEAGELPGREQPHRQPGTAPSSPDNATRLRSSPPQDSSGSATLAGSTSSSPVASWRGSRRPRTGDGAEDDDDYDDSRQQQQQRRERATAIRFAPWNVPLRRRLQTFAVLAHSLSILTLLSFFLFLCAIPLTWPLLIPYLIHCTLSNAAADGKLAYRWQWLRRSRFWDLFAGYFPATLHRTEPLPPTRKYIFGYHPHGIISHGAFAAFATDSLGFSKLFPGIDNALLTLENNFRIPFYRDYILAMGLRSVSRESITNILTQGGPNGEGMGRAVTIVVGGARESLMARPHTLRLVLKERKGFIRLAIKTGADLVPVLAFGENDLYDQLAPETHPLIHRAQMFALKAWKFTLPCLHGRGIFNYDVGLMPYRRPMNIVVGRPIHVEARSIPDPDEVDRLHTAYMKELRRIWDDGRDQFAPDTKEMDFLS